MSSESMEALQRLAALEPGFSTYCDLGSSLLHAERYSDAERAFRMALALDSKVPKGWQNLASSLLAQNRHSDAADAFRGALALDPTSITSLRGLGNALLSARQPEAALEPIRQALCLDGSHASSWRLLGAALGRLKRHAEALEALQEARKIEPGSISIRREIAYQEQYLGRDDDAIASFLELLAEQPECLQWTVELGRLHARNRRFDEATVFFQRCLALDPRSAAVLQGLGMVSRKHGLAPEAVAFFEKAIEYHPRDIASLFQLAQLNEQNGDLAASMAHLAALLAINPADSNALMLRAQVSFELGQIDLALGDLEQVARVAPGNARTDIWATIIRKQRAYLQPDCRSGGSLAQVTRSVASAPHSLAIAIGAGIGNMIQCGPMIRRISEHLGQPIDVILNEDFPGCEALFIGSEWVNAVFWNHDFAQDVEFERVLVLGSWGNLVPKFNAAAVVVARRHGPVVPDEHEAISNLICAHKFLQVPFEPLDARKYFVGKFAREKGLGRLIGLHAGSKNGRWAVKQWPHFEALAKRLAKDGFSLVSFGSSGEYVPGTLDATETPLRKTISNIARCDYFIANDSGLMHIADALQLPLSAIFGPTSTQRVGPLSSESRTIVLKKWCAPCLNSNRFSNCTCIGDISTDQVYESVASHLGDLGIFSAKQ